MGLTPARQAPGARHGAAQPGQAAQPVRPQYRLLANRADITATVADRFISLRYTDEAGLDSDMLEITLADHDPARPIQLPPTGAELELSLGYDGRLQRVGLFVVDELELSGWPGQMTIRARATPFEGSKGGMSQLQSQKTRSWPKDTLLGDVVRTIAAEHKMQAVVAPEMAGIVLPHQDQMDESDLNFLVRLAKRYDGVIKPAAAKLVLAKRGQAKTASGQSIPTVRLVPGDVSDYRVSLTKRDGGGTVVAYWHATKQAKREEVKIGQGEPVLRLKRYYQAPEVARAAAQAEYDSRVRRQATLSLSMPGRIDVLAEGRLELAGFRPGVSGAWIVTRAEHSLDDSGYRTDIEAEQERFGAATLEAPAPQLAADS